MMMRREAHSVWPALATLGALVLAGCSSKTTLDTEYVEGVVTLDGKPVPEAMVTFAPVSQGQGMSATGMTDEQGKYTLTAVGSGELAAKPGAGTLPGEYYVGVVKSEAEVPLSAEEAEKQGLEYKPPSMPTEPKITHIVPQKYNNPRKSGLKVTVQEGENSIPIELSSQ